MKQKFSIIVYFLTDSSISKVSGNKDLQKWLLIASILRINALKNEKMSRKNRRDINKFELNVKKGLKYKEKRILFNTFDQRIARHGLNFSHQKFFSFQNKFHFILNDFHIFMIRCAYIRYLEQREEKYYIHFIDWKIITF